MKSNGLILTLGVLFIAGSVMAASKTWLGGNSDWFTDGNWSPSGTPTNDDSVVITNAGATPVLSNSTANLNSLTISNKSLIFTNWQTTLNAATVTVQNAGAFTVPLAFTNGQMSNGIFIVCTSLVVQSGGQISADFRGFKGGDASGSGPGGGVAVGGAGSGGGYGGAGGCASLSGYSPVGTGGATYGSATNPIAPGSGGAGWAGNQWGAPGGGYIQIVAADAISNNGLITACGSNAPDYGIFSRSGGGSGGGILLRCRALAGTGGILAAGGNWYGSSGVCGGGGGGGRIAIYVSQPASYGGSLSAKAGTSYTTQYDPTRRWGAYASCPGTIYLSDWSILPPVLSGGGQAAFSAGGGRAGDVTITNYTVYVDNGWSNNWVKAGAIVIQTNGVIQHLWNTAITTNALGQWIPNAGVFLDCASLTIASGGQINADGLGYAGGLIGGSGTDGYGNGGGKLGGQTAGGGGGYGGAGGNGGNPACAGGTTYGSATNPAEPGSGGAVWNGPPGGCGGGYIRIVANGAIVNNGSITACGLNAIDQRLGGGSGGGILIQSGSLSGAGSILAKGGNRHSVGGGGGGGGRIAIYARNAPYYTGGNMLFAAPPSGGTIGTIDATGSPGSPGTIYIDKLHPRGTLLSTW
jgi:hypothetical protein